MNPVSIPPPAFRPSACVLLVAILATVLATLAPLAAQETELRFSGDIHTGVPGAGGMTLTGPDEAVFVFDADAATGQVTLPLGFQDGGAIDGHDFDRYTVETITVVAGVVMQPADVFLADGTKVFDAAAAGVPDNVNIDAISRDPDGGDLVFSIDSHAVLGTTAFRPSDLIAWDGAGFSLWFGDFPAGALDVDALHLYPDGGFLVSFATDLELGGTVARAPDVIRGDLSGGLGSSLMIAFTPPGGSWQAANLDALWAERVLAGTFAWSDMSVEVLEDAGTVSLTIVRSGGTESAVTVDYDIVEGSAMQGVDFTGSGGSEAFADGQAGATVDIGLIDNDTVDGDKDFTVILIAADGHGAIGSPSQVRVLIRDDEDFLFADGFES